MAMVALPAPIDPSHRANFPIIIGDDLLREENPRKRQRISVQYNYRPDGLNNETTSIITTNATESDALTMLSKSEGEPKKYTFEGAQKVSSSLALIYDQEKTAFVLDRIGTDCYFNLRTTPSEKDVAKNIARYPQIGTIESRVDTSNSDGKDENDDFENQSPDPDNPYDYRHFLNRKNSPPPQRSAQNSPRPDHAFNSSPLLRTTSPIQRPRSRTAPEKPPKARRRHLSPGSSRKTKIHRDIHDSNELVIDMGDSDPTPSKTWHRSILGDMFNEQGRSGDRKPMSMRSVANSMSPSVRAESDYERDDKRDNDVEEIDLGESRLSDRPAENGDGNVDTEADAEGNGWDDEVDDILQQEMDQAMESQGDPKQNEASYKAIPLVESSSESEEE